MDRKHLELITELRRALHRIPETAGNERATMAAVRDFLRQRTSCRIVPREGWMYAYFPGRQAAGKGSGAELPGIAFRAELDALPIPEDAEEPGALPYASTHPGISHRCGHDGHMAALCGLALALEADPPERPVWLIFQHAEETGAGGKTCSALLAEKGISEVYAFHNLGGYPEGTLLYRRGLTQPASEGLRLSFTGRACHASAPEDGVNPAAAAARTVLYMEERQRAAHEGLLLATVTGLTAGTGDFGISAGSAELRATLRADDEARMFELEREVTAFAAREAEAAGASVSSEIRDLFPETRNDGACLDRVLSAAADCGIPSMEMPRPWRASEDFGWYLKACPGAIFYIGTGEDWPALHTAEYDFNDAVLPAAVDVFTRLAGMPAHVTAPQKGPDGIQ